jgi:hypothetical protein
MQDICQLCGFKLTVNYTLVDILEGLCIKKESRDKRVISPTVAGISSASAPKLCIDYLFKKFSNNNLVRLINCSILIKFSDKLRASLLTIKRE